MASEFQWQVRGAVAGGVEEAAGLLIDALLLLFALSSSPPTSLRTFARVFVRPYVEGLMYVYTVKLCNQNLFWHSFKCQTAVLN